MTKINFDQDLMRNIRIIYGDADLDNMTLLNIYETWQRNPEIIRNTARLKMGNLEGPKAIELAATPAPLQIILVLLEIADDDLRGVLNFGAAFKEARSRGLKLFRWGKGVYGTLLALKPSKPEQPSTIQIPLSDTLISIEATTKGTTWGRGIPTITGGSLPASELTRAELPSSKPKVNPVQATTSRYTMGNTVQGGDFGIGRGIKRAGQAIGKGFMGFLNLLNEGAANNLYSRNKLINPLSYYQQGGTMNNQQELQKAFVAYLILDAQTLGVQILSEQDLQTYAEQLGEDGIKAKYQEFVQRMQGGSTMARLGAKLQYYKKLKGACPEGEEMVYFKLGGRICKSCQKKQQQAPMAQGGKKMNAIDEFKNKKKDINPNDTVNTKKGPRDLNGKTKYPKWNPSKEENSIEERIRVVEKDEKSGKKVFGSKCGAKMKKKK